MSPHSHSSAARRAHLSAVVAVALVPALAACSAFGNSSSSTTAPATAAAGTTGASGATGAASSAATPGNSTSEPLIVAATTGGGLVRLNPASGAVVQTLVPNGTGVEGDEISVSGKGMVYYAVGSGACDSTIYAIPDGGGGTPNPVVSGRLPAISPDGTKLAYAVEPGSAQDCSGWNTSTPGTAWKVEVRTIASGATDTIPEIPPSQQGLPAPVAHLSWASDNDHLAVSIQSVEDNEGWALNILDTSSVRTYEDATTVPVTGASPDGQSYLSEGVYLPDGDLFVVHNCCMGVPAKTDAPLLWEVQPNGSLVHQVTIGFAKITHDSLDASADGNWLLYLGGGDLYVSQGGNRPTQIASGMIAAAWGA